MSSLNDIKLTYKQQEEFKAVLSKFKKDMTKNVISCQKDDIFLGEIFIGKIDNPLEIGENIVAILVKKELLNDI